MVKTPNPKRHLSPGPKARPMPPDPTDDQSNISAALTPVRSVTTLASLTSVPSNSRWGSLPHCARRRTS